MYLSEDHSGDFLRRESLGLTEVLDLDLGAVLAILNDLEWPRLNVLLDGWVIESPSDQTPTQALACEVHLLSIARSTHLTSKTVLTGFMAAWFFAASPIKRSSAVKETKDGVVKLPCSLATIGDC